MVFSFLSLVLREATQPKPYPRNRVNTILLRIAVTVYALLAGSSLFTAIAVDPACRGAGLFLVLWFGTAWTLPSWKYDVGAVRPTKPNGTLVIALLVVFASQVLGLNSLAHIGLALALLPLCPRWTATPFIFLSAFSWIPALGLLSTVGLDPSQIFWVRVAAFCFLLGAIPLPRPKRIAP
jgi:hypothetical protein